MEDIETLIAKQRELFWSISPKQCYPCRYDAMNCILEESNDSVEVTDNWQPFI